VPVVECGAPASSYERVLGEIIERLELQQQVSPRVWLRDDLLIDRHTGTAWFRDVELTKLQADSHPFKFAVMVASAEGSVVKKDALNKALSHHADDTVARKAKLDLVKAIKASYDAAGKQVPNDVGDLFVAQGGGYVLKGSARVL
jgi:hypothetical protein